MKLDLQSFIDNVPVALFRSTPGPDGVLLWYNSALRELFGLPPSLDDDERVRAADCYADPADRRRFSDLLSETGEVRDFEVRFKRRDGTFFWGRISAQLIETDDGAVCFDGMLADVSAEIEARQAAERREHYLQAVLRALGDSATIVYDYDGRCLNIWSSPCFDRSIRIDSEKLDGLRLHDYLPTQIADERLRMIREVFEGGAPRTLEYRLPEEHNEVWIETVSSPIRAADGTVQQVVTLARDVSDRKRAELELREDRARMRTLLDNLPFPVWSVDRDLRYVTLNEAFIDFCGDLRGQTLEAVEAPQAHKARWRDLARRVLDGENIAEDFEFADPDGGMRHYHMLLAPIEDEGCVLGLVGVSLDMTDTVRALERVQAGEARYRMIVENITDTVMVTEADGRISYMSPSAPRTWGWDLDALIGAPPDELMRLTVPPEAMEHTREVHAAALRGEVGREVEMQVLTAAGERRWVAHSWAPIHRGGELHQIVSVVKDITADRQERSELLQRDRILGAIAYITGHMLSADEWETMLSGVLGRLGRAMSASRVTMLRVGSTPEGESDCRIEYEWMAGDAPPRRGTPEEARLNICTMGDGNWRMRLRAGEVIAGRTENFPENERARLRQWPAHSVCVVPLTMDERPGVIVFEDCLHEREWSAAEMDALRSIGEMLGAVLHRLHVERELRETQARQRILLDSLPLVLCYADADLHLREWNRFGERLLGRARDQVLGRSPVDALAIEPDVLEEVMAQAAIHGRYDGEIQLPHANGRRILMRLVLVPERDDQGRIHGWLAYAEDLTERRATEAALHETSSRLSLLFENNVMGVVITDMQGRIIESNERWDEMIGYTPEEQRALTFREITADEEVAATEQRFRQLVDGERRSQQVEKQFKRKDGTTFWVELFVSVIEDVDGRPVALIGLVNDISARREAQRALEEDRNLLLLLIDHLPHDVFVKDCESRFVLVNRSIVLNKGFADREAAIGKCDFDFCVPEEAEHHYALEQELMRTGEPVIEREESFFDPQGRQNWYLSTKVPLRNSDGEVIGLVGINQSITERKRQEEALRWSERRYRGLVESQSDMVVRVDADGRFTFVNESFCRKFGRPPQDLLGRKFIPLVHPEDREATLRAMDGLYRPPYRVRVQQRAQTVQGWRWLEWEDYAIRDESGRIVEIQAAGRDITEAKRAEETLRASELRYRMTVESIPVLVATLDEGERFTMWNRQAELALGYGAAEVLGRLRGTDVLAQADDWPAIVEAVERGGRFLGEVELQAADGSTLPFELIVLPTAGRDSGSHGYYVFGRDLSERKEAEQQSQLLTAVVSESAETVIVTDQHGVVQYVNPAFSRLSGFGADEVLGRRLNMLSSGVHSTEFYRELWETITRGEVWRGRFVNRRKDGERFEQMATITPLRDGHGEIASFVSIQLDVTRIASLERELAKAERLAAIGQTILGVAHYLKNICANLKGSASLIERGLNEEKYHNIVPLWGIFTRNADRIADLTQQMLAFCRTEELNLQPMDLHELAEDVVEQSLALAEHHAVELSLERPAQLPFLPCDGLRITDVLLNLVGNAIHAASERAGGRVLIRLSRPEQDGVVRIEVEDNGTGIAEEHLERIFDPFFTTKGNKGTGLGLAMVQKIVRAHGGRIDVQSTPGLTVFTVDLPLHAGADLSDAGALVLDRDGDTADGDGFESQDPSGNAIAGVPDDEADIWPAAELSDGADPED